MKHRKAFTLLEMLVVIGVIVLLVGLLLPVIFGARRKAEIIAGKSDFQTITAALEAYHNDFRDYPRNVQLPVSNTQISVLPLPHPQYDLSLAAALMGPGPGVTKTLSGTTPAVLEDGDGADGMGFRTQTQIYSLTLSGAVTAGEATVTATGSATALNYLQYNYVSGTTVAWITLSAGNTGNTVYADPEETLGIGSAIVSGGSATITFANGTSPVYAHPLTEANGQSTNFVLKVATGKIWSSYLPADSFKVAFEPATDVNGTNLSGIGYGEPVLLDRWGQVIQYFPRYGPVSNRTYDSVLYTAVNTSIIAGPLYGYSQPKSIDSINGRNAMWDFRDAAPFYTIVANQSNPVLGQQWKPIVSTAPPSMSGIPTASPVPTTTPYYFDPVSVLQWMLGALDNTTSPPGVNNDIDPNCKLLFDGPYILISAGPDGPDRANGGFCSFVDPNSGNPFSVTSWQQTFNASGNIYNFDAP